MKNRTTVFLMICLFIPAFLNGKTTKRNADSDKITVAAYYFPNYHTNDPRNIKNKGADWSEW